jgi:hypothetical protein
LWSEALVEIDGGIEPDGSRVWLARKATTPQLHILLLNPA